MACLTLSAKEIKAAPVEVRRWLERQIRGSLDHAAMLDNPAKDSASPPKVLASSIAPNESTTEGNGEMNKNESATGNAAVRRLIAERAYELWENQGKPLGCDLIHWRGAEQEIIDCLGPSARDPFGLLRD